MSNTDQPAILVRRQMTPNERSTATCLLMAHTQKSRTDLDAEHGGNHVLLAKGRGVLVP